MCVGQTGRVILPGERLGERERDWLKAQEVLLTTELVKAERLQLMPHQDARVAVVVVGPMLVPCSPFLRLTRRL